MSITKDKRLQSNDNVMLDILLPSLLLMALGAALHSVVKQASSRGRGKSELPIHRRSLSTSPTNSPWVIERHGLSVSVTTTGFNNLPSQFLDVRGSRLKTALLLFYNIGTFVGVLGGIAAIGATIWQLVQIWGTVWLEVRSHAAEKGEVVGLVKRALEDLSETSAGESTPPLQGLQPLIPGVTLPLRHLPTLVLALVVNQLIHELGHALSAAVEDIIPSSFSLNLHFVLFSMAVHLPPTVDYLPSRAKMRLASSGPFHNLVTYGWLALLAFSGTGNLLWSDRSDVGRLVQTVSETSPLYRHISPGRLITHLDDVTVAGEGDVWSKYLSGEISSDHDRGWCIDKYIFTGLPDSPCPPDSGKVGFSAPDANTPGSSKCMDPNPILYSPSVACPCPSLHDICIRPLQSERIMQIRLADGEVVLWQGDRTLVMRDIQVGRKGARFLGPVTRWGTTFIEYLSTIALSLFLFNLLPLPHTDGSQLLKALLASTGTPSMFSLGLSRSHPLTRSRSPSRSRQDRPTISIRHTSAQEYDLASDSDDGHSFGYGHDVEGRMRGTREEAWKKRSRRVVEGGSVVMAIGWVAGWAMLALLRSS